MGGQLKAAVSIQSPHKASPSRVQEPDAGFLLLQSPLHPEHPLLQCEHPPSSGLLWALHSAGKRRGVEEAEEPGAAQPVSFGGFLQVQTGPCTVPWEHPAWLLTHTVQDGHVSSTNIF